MKVNESTVKGANCHFLFIFSSFFLFGEGGGYCCSVNWFLTLGSIPAPGLAMSKVVVAQPRSMVFSEHSGFLHRKVKEICAF